MMLLYISFTYVHGNSNLRTSFSFRPGQEQWRRVLAGVCIGSMMRSARPSSLVSVTGLARGGCCTPARGHRPPGCVGGDASHGGHCPPHAARISHEPHGGGSTVLLLEVAPSLTLPSVRPLRRGRPAKRLGSIPAFSLECSLGTRPLLLQPVRQLLSSLSLPLSCAERCP
jgi:hypothetical protein